MEPDSSWPPSQEKARLVTRSACAASKSFTRLPVASFQTLTLPSCAPDATSSPLRLKHRAVTGASCIMKRSSSTVA